MLILTATTDNLQIVLGGAITTSQLQAIASWRDITTTAYTPGRTVASSNSTTDVNLVAAPAVSTQRVIDFLAVYNSDTANATVTIKFDANGTEYTIWKGLLQPGERVEYTDSGGFSTFSTNGLVVTAPVNGTWLSPTANVLNTVVLSSDVVNADAVANTLADVTGLSFSVTNNEVYWFKFIVNFLAAATGTGSRWTINGPAVTDLGYRSTIALSATTITTNNAAAIQIPAASSGTSANTTGNIAIVEGIIRPSANGTVQLQFASEVTVSAITAKAGSLLQWMRTL